MCFSLAWIENVLIWLVIVCAVVGLLRLVLPFVLAQLGVAGDLLMKAINIVVWAIVCVAVIIFVFDLVGCLLGGGIGFPRMR